MIHCIHLGPIIDGRTLKSGRRITFHSCPLHGTCSESSALPKLARPCASCADRQLPAATTPQNKPVAGGPGTELKRLLKRIGITARPGCKCNARAREMDNRGCAWCRDNLDTIVGWLREEAQRAGLPFNATLAAGLVRLAIRRAEKSKLGPSTREKSGTIPLTKLAPR